MNANPFLVTLWLFLALISMIIPSISKTLPARFEPDLIAGQVINSRSGKKMCSRIDHVPSLGSETTQYSQVNPVVESGRHLITGVGIPRVRK